MTVFNSQFPNFPFSSECPMTNAQPGALDSHWSLVIGH